MKNLLGFVIAMIILFTLAATDTQALSIRCGVRLISEGDLKPKVLAECGEPDHVEIWEEERIYRYRYKTREDSRYHGYLEPRYIKDIVVVEEWTYNRGRHRFMDHIRFENGKVKRIETGDYGY
jgi:hypothetical protein